jgi:hypothetical protein
MKTLREMIDLIKEAEAKLPGASPGMKIMSVDQFVAKSDDASEKEVDEATKLPASQRDLTGKELQDYLTRVQGTPKRDKLGNVIKKKDRVSKKGVVTPGKDDYTSGKLKTDKYSYPYVHRNSAITYFDSANNQYDESKIIKDLKVRPTTLLKQNEKMKHSNGSFEQFFNVGFAALVGIAVDESTNKLIIVDTCPGAGSCKTECFAMKGGKIQFEAAWLSDGRILTYLLNDPEGFSNQLKQEIKAEYNQGKAGDKKFPNGWKVSIRWHDAGDFFSPEYLKLAFDIASAFPDVDFYAYTKIAGAALSKKPANFIINWSEGANTKQEKQVKSQDSTLQLTKNSRIVPEKLFYDLLAKDEKGNLAKGPNNQWQIATADGLKELKQRLAKAYGIPSASILSYDEYVRKPKIGNLKYNVIVAPGEGDISAKDPDVTSTLLLRH